MIPGIGGCPVPGDGIECPLCRHARTNIAARLNEAHASLSGKVSPQSLYRTLLTLYTEEVEITGESIGILTPSIIHEHYEQHVVAVHKSISDDIMFTSAIQRHLQTECVATPAGEGVHISAPAVNDWVKLSKHKIALLAAYTTLIRPTTHAPKAHPYDLS